MTPVDVGPSFGLFWLLLFGLPALVLLGALGWRMGWFGSGCRLARLWAKIQGWFGRPPMLTRAVSAEQQRELAYIESERLAGRVSDADYQKARAVILGEA